MRKLILLTVFCLFSFIVTAQKRVLVFSKTNGFRHKSIDSGKEMFKNMFSKDAFTITFSEDSLVFNKRFLAKIDVIVFLSTTGNILGTAQEEALMKYIHKGGGFVGIHAATDTELKWEWYVNMVGGAFKNHPKQQEATINIVNNDFEAMQHFGKTWLHFDEWYNFKAPINSNCVVLATVDETTYKGGTMNNQHPVVWYQNYEGGRIFVTALGHTNETFAHQEFKKMIEKAVIWAGKKK